MSKNVKLFQIDLVKHFFGWSNQTPFLEVTNVTLWFQKYTNYVESDFVHFVDFDDLAVLDNRHGWNKSLSKWLHTLTFLRNNLNKPEWRMVVKFDA